jgi:hypothetical protein
MERDDSDVMASRVFFGILGLTLMFMIAAYVFAF